MRRYHLRVIQEMLQVLHEAHGELGMSTEADEAIEILAACQEYALEVGNYIESVADNYSLTISTLEDYCDCLFSLSNEIKGSGEHAVYAEILKKQLIAIDNSVNSELVPTRAEIVFLSYKASMSDSLESIYHAAKNDPNCDAIWIPIPYYERDNNSIVGEMQLEGAECYNETIECTDWQAYDIESQHPDAIFTFSPYDDWNKVTTVHPDFYCERLRNFTDELVYVPYFVLGDDVKEAFCTLPGCIYADKVFVQSESMRDRYIEFFGRRYGTRFGDADAKFIALGSPKFDAAINAKREDFSLPDEWKALANGKKIILYSITLEEILIKNTQYLSKLRNVIEVFRRRNDILLWWRPHPLTEATYASMLPDLLDDYKKIVDEFKKEGWGIFDETTDHLRAIAWCDGYYGDGNSMPILCGIKGIPIMIQNVSESAKETTPNSDMFFDIKNDSSILQWQDFLIHEANETTLDQYLDHIVSGFGTVDGNGFSKRQIKAFSRLAENAQGRSGEAIYDYVINDTMNHPITERRVHESISDILAKEELLESLESIDGICRFVESHTVESIVKIVSDSFNIDPVQLVAISMGGYSRVLNEDGTFFGVNGCYAFVLEDVKRNIDEYKWVYSLLCDDISREVFLSQLRYRLLPSIQYIQNAYEISSKYAQYFDEEVFVLGQEEVFVDCGGYIGDTTEEFIARCIDYKRIYVYEPLEENFIKCQENLVPYKNIVLRQAGVGMKSSKMAFSGSGGSGSFAATTENSDIANYLDIVALDEDIEEKVTFIKMDIECFEPDAIRGAAKHIKEDSPKLAICLYHMISDIWEIPKIINEINPNYHFYLRHYDQNHNWELVLYAIAKEDNHCETQGIDELATSKGQSSEIKSSAKTDTMKLSDISRNLWEFIEETEELFAQIEQLSSDTVTELYNMHMQSAKTATDNIADIDTEIRVVICDRLDRLVDKIADFEISLAQPEQEQMHVYTPAVQGYRKWGNVELLKDKGLTGYLIAKEIKAKAVMFFGSKQEDYPYLSQLPDIEIVYSEALSGDAAAYYEHLLGNYKKMDVLILHGMYNETMLYLDEYRKLRPDGIVYCGLDMNSYWMSNIDWNSSAARKFAHQCDIIATSCRFLRDELNRNKSVHFPCRWIPNAFYSTIDAEATAKAENKKDIILTVGRIGTAQKNNQELLTAFALVSDVLPSWELRLVGPVEPDFQPFINYYFAQRPDLVERVTFTGAITDKPELYSEYAASKVFALTSMFEGGTPNVYAEALVHGCKFITSNIDAAEDITNYGELGYIYPRGNIDALASSLIGMCTRSGDGAFDKYIPKALDYAAMHYDWSRNAKKLAYMLLHHGLSSRK